MKQLIKKIIPKPVLNNAINILDKKRLQGVPKQSFDSAHLKKIDGQEIATIFGDKEIEKLWQNTQDDICALFGEDHTFGGINPGDRRALYYLITALKPQKVLEVGTHIGASTLYIACALKNIDSNAIVTTVDILDVNGEQAPWKKLGLKMSPRDFADRLDCLDHINFKVSPAQKFMESTEEKFDFIFLDGDHSSQAVYQEVSGALKVLKPNGVILLHDYYPEAKPLFSNGNIIAGPFRALDRIRTENKEISVQPLGELPWPTKLNSNITSLAITTKIE